MQRCNRLKTRQGLAPPLHLFGRFSFGTSTLRLWRTEDMDGMDQDLALYRQGGGKGF